MKQFVYKPKRTCKKTGKTKTGRVYRGRFKVGTMHKAADVPLGVTDKGKPTKKSKNNER